MLSSQNMTYAVIDFPFHAYNQADNSSMLCAIIMGLWKDILWENLWRGL